MNIDWLGNFIATVGPFLIVAWVMKGMWAKIKDRKEK
jgi:hypothetical protein